MPHYEYSYDKQLAHALYGNRQPSRIKMKAQTAACLAQLMRMSEKTVQSHMPEKNITAVCLHSNEYKKLCNMAGDSPYAGIYNIRRHFCKNFYDTCFVDCFCMLLCRLLGWQHIRVWRQQCWVYLDLWLTFTVLQPKFSLWRYKMLANLKREHSVQCNGHCHIAEMA